MVQHTHSQQPEEEEGDRLQMRVENDILPVEALEGELPVGYPVEEL